MSKTSKADQKIERDDVTITELYGGKVHVKFYEKSHQYWISRDGGKNFARKTGVTKAQSVLQCKYACNGRSTGRIQQESPRKCETMCRMQDIFQTQRATEIHSQVLLDKMQRQMAGRKMEAGQTENRQD